MVTWGPDLTPRTGRALPAGNGDAHSKQIIWEQRLGSCWAQAGAEEGEEGQVDEEDARNSPTGKRGAVTKRSARRGPLPGAGERGRLRCGEPSSLTPSPAHSWSPL